MRTAFNTLLRGGILCDCRCDHKRSGDDVVEVALAVAEEETTGKGNARTIAVGSAVTPKDAGVTPGGQNVSLMPALTNGMSQVTDSSMRRRVLLTDQGRQYIEAMFPSIAGSENLAGVAGVEVKSAGQTQDGWADYYDTAKLTLIRRDAWLRKRSSTWELLGRQLNSSASLLADDAPLAAKSGDAQYDVICDTNEISACIAPAVQVDVAADSKASFDNVLAAHGVRPFARLHTEHRFFRSESSAVSSARFIIDLEVVHFDTAYAEPAAVSMMVPKNGTDLRETLTAAFADFRLEGDPSKILPSNADHLTDFLLKHGLDAGGGGSLPGRSAVIEYIQRCRPTQLHTLQTNGAFLLDA